jgi:hypothetical protein
MGCFASCGGGSGAVAVVWLRRHDTAWGSGTGGRHSAGHTWVGIGIGKFENGYARQP